MAANTNTNTNEDWTKQLTSRFEQILQLKRQQRQSAETNVSDHPFYQQILGLRATPERYEDAALLDKALAVLNLDQIYSDADEMAAKDSALGYQDSVIRALMKWFKEEFFEWVNAPSCDQCEQETRPTGHTSPSAEEQAKGAGRVELYRCVGVKEHVVRFPRYDHPEPLLTWRRGRCGEWANCFTLLCRAVGSRARWVWNAEDHVWTEVYSETQKRWIHCDSCENAWDQPQLYAEGWGKKMSYCLAFGASGARDVTKRYVRDPNHALPRNKAPEYVVAAAMREINKQAKVHMNQEERSRLEAEDRQEDEEQQSYKSIPTRIKPEELQPRESGRGEWTAKRGEDGQKK